MSWRDVLQAEFGSRMAWLVRNDRKAMLVGLIKLVNAVWFAGLWQAGLKFDLALLVWLVFFVVTMLLAFRLDSAGFNQQGEE